MPFSKMKLKIQSAGCLNQRPALVFLGGLLFLLMTGTLLAGVRVTTYEELIAAIRAAKSQSRERIEQAVQQDKVREAWEIGKLIDEHVLRHKERADYADYVLNRLAKDMGVSRTELYYMLEFARAYPIVPHAGQLSWSEYRDLLGVNDPKQRKAVARQAEKENWGRGRLREEIRKLNVGTDSGKPADALMAGVRPPLASDSEHGPTHGSAPTLVAQPGKPGIHKIVKATVGPLTGRLVLSLGFSNYFDYQQFLSMPDKEGAFKEGDIVELKQEARGGEAKRQDSTLLLASDLSVSDLYTYRAYAAQVIDGDTFKAAIDLGLGVWTVQKLRLRGLDAPEIESREGKEAKEFVEKMLVGANGNAPVRKSVKNADDQDARRASLQTNFVLIRTVKSDKYDRYLVDVWVGETYINQALIDEGLAAAVSE